MQVNNNMDLKKKIRKTKSMCPVCMEIIDAEVHRDDDKVFLSKSCIEHGEYNVLLSGNAHYYCRLEGFYFDIMKNSYSSLLEYEIWPTLRCNMGCEICCFGSTRADLEGKEPSCEDIERFIASHKSSFYTLSGGEPTCRNDLVQIISMLKKNKRTVTINTNGLKFIDLEYIKQLKNAGLDRVNIQFDGFTRQTYKSLRGDDLLEKKMKIMNNLSLANIQTTINAVVAKNINENEIIPLLEYAVKNNFINGLTFFTICYMGDTRDWPIERLIMPDEIIDIVDKETKGKINRKSVFLFQKLHLGIKSFLRQKYCLYNQVYLLVRYQGGYEPIDSFLNFQATEMWMELFRRQVKSRILSGVFLGIALLSLFLHKRAIFILKEVFAMGMSYFFKTSYYLNNKRFLSISFSTGCDPLKLDYDMLANCKTGVIAAEKKSGHIECFKQGCTYNLTLEKAARKICTKVKKQIHQQNKRD